jgi:DNA-binding response OmpR family regulator
MLHLLLAEDNPGDVLLVREALRTSAVDADMVVAYDGEKALTFLASQRFDLAILDLNLPRADGHTILQKYAMVDGSPPIVVFTSSSSPKDSDAALAAGAKEYLVKPTLLDDFIHSVHGILERWSDPIQQATPTSCPLLHGIVQPTHKKP